MNIDDRRVAAGPQTVAATEIPIGTVFYGMINGDPQELLLKAYGEVVSLSDPSNTWDLEVIVCYYQPVNVTVVVDSNVEGEE